MSSSNYKGSADEFSAQLNILHGLYTQIHPSSDEKQRATSTANPRSGSSNNKDRYLCGVKHDQHRSILNLTVSNMVSVWQLSIDFNAFQEHKLAIGMQRGISWHNVFNLLKQAFEINNKLNRGIIYTFNNNNEEQLILTVTYTLTSSIELIGQWTLNQLANNSVQARSEMSDLVFDLLEHYKKPRDTMRSTQSEEVAKSQREISDLKQQVEQLRSEVDQVTSERDKLALSASNPNNSISGSFDSSSLDNQPNSPGKRKATQQNKTNRSVLNPTAKRRKAGGFKLG
jgi:hypothetical protein